MEGGHVNVHIFQQLQYELFLRFLAACELLMMLVQNDCLQMLLTERSPLPPTQSCTAWRVGIDVCLTGSPERDKVQRLACRCITRALLVSLSFVFVSGGSIWSKSFPRLCWKHQITLTLWVAVLPWRMDKGSLCCWIHNELMKREHS